MTDIFIKVIEMSITASVVIAVIIVLRLLLRKAPKVFSYVLWAAALFRLLCPISFQQTTARKNLTSLIDSDNGFSGWSYSISTKHHSHIMISKGTATSFLIPSKLY